jgi:uncharacterized protein YgiM (DUF1202 family)
VTEANLVKERQSGSLHRNVRRVIADYQSPYPSPLKVSAGEEMAIGSRKSEWPGWIWCTTPDGQSGWMPEAYVARRGDVGTALHDYDATELSVRTGQEVATGKEESGWIWCTDRDGQSGWVPEQHLSSEAGGG